MKLSKQEREAVILDSSNLLKKVLRRYRVMPDVLENLTQEGYRAICEAVDSYREDSGFKLQSHIYYYVRKEVFLAYKREFSEYNDEFVEETCDVQLDTSHGGRGGVIETMLQCINKMRKPIYRNLFISYLNGDKSVTIRRLGTPIEYLRETMEIEL